MRRMRSVSLLVIAACSSVSCSATQQPDAGVWFGVSTSPPETFGRFDIARQSSGLVILWAPFGKATVNSGAITVRPDSSIEFQWATSPPLACALRRADARNYEGTCHGAGQIERRLTLTRNPPPAGLQVPVSDTDVRILARARELLSGPTVWNRHDDRACEDGAKQNSWSLYCAFYQASMDVAGAFLPARPAMTELRGAVGEVRNGRQFPHLLMDWNNLESTTYADIASALDRTAKRLQTRTTCTAPHAAEWSEFGPVTASNFKGTIASDSGDVFWNEPITYTVRKETYRLNAMVGPMATSGSADDEWGSASTVITRRTWRLNDLRGVDMKGELRNGNRWRFFGQCGDYLDYYDVPAEAAAYFDGIIDGVYFHTGR